MIEQLGYEGRRIFEADLSEDMSTLVLIEACDMYFEAKLTREEVIELANDFMRIAETMNSVA